MGCVKGCCQPLGFERLVARNIVTRSTFAPAGDFGLRFFDAAAPAGRSSFGSFGNKLPAKSYQRAWTLHSSYGVHFRTAKILQHSIQQLCQLSWYRGESIGQVQQRNNGCTPSKACLETVHTNFETPKANRRVESNFAHHQRIVLQFTANEVRKITP